MAKILFIVPSSSLSGSPIALLRYLKASQLPKNWKLYFYTKGGDLTPNFAKLGKVIKPCGRNFLKVLFWKRFFPMIRLYIEILLSRFTIIYANNILGYIGLDNFIIPSNTALIIHIHELPLAINRLLPSFSIKRKRNATYFFTTSYLSKKYLEKKLDSGNKVSIFTPLISKPVLSIHRKEIRKQLNIKNNTILIGYVGSVSIRKGYYDFIQLAYSLKKYKYIQLLYIGPFEIKKTEVMHDLKHAGLVEKVFFLGAKHKLDNYFNSMDIFVSFSKEEAFGMSLVEAAAHKLPLLCYKNTGMQSILVKEAEGILVDYLDIPTMTEEIINLINNPPRLLRMGLASYKMASSYFMDSKKSSIWANTIKEIVINSSIEK